MKPNEETPIDEITLTSVLNEHATDLKEIKNFMKEQQQQIDQKNQLLLDKEKQTAVLIANFEIKFKNITVDAPKPDLSEVNAVLNDNLTAINTTIAKGPKPVMRQLRLLLFPEQLRTIEYVKVVLTRVIICIITLVFMSLVYALLKK